MYKISLKFGTMFCCMLALGCAFDLAHVNYRPAVLNQVESETASFILTSELPIEGVPCGYNRTLRKNTHWQAIGRLAEGVVFRSPDQTLTVECSNVHEAYIVVENQRLVGFYLPVEKGFSSLDKPLQLAVSF